MSPQRPPLVLVPAAVALAIAPPALAAFDDALPAMPPGPVGYFAIGFVLVLAVALLLGWLLEDGTDECGESADPESGNVSRFGRPDRDEPGERYDETDRTGAGGAYRREHEASDRRAA